MMDYSTLINDCEVDSINADDCQKKVGRMIDSLMNYIYDIYRYSDAVPVGTNELVDECVEKLEKLEKHFKKSKQKCKKIAKKLKKEKKLEECKKFIKDNE